MLAVIAGMASLILSGVSYSYNFSTIVRVGRKAELSVEVMDQDGSGRDPLPEYLKHARLDIGPNTATAKELETAESPAEQQSLVSVPGHPSSRSRTVRTI